jgi:hypothetical protein
MVAAAGVIGPYGLVTHGALERVPALNVAIYLCHKLDESACLSISY